MLEAKEGVGVDIIVDINTFLCVNTHALGRDVAVSSSGPQSRIFKRFWFFIYQENNCSPRILFLSCLHFRLAVKMWEAKTWALNLSQVFDDPIISVYLTIIHRIAYVFYFYISYCIFW